jgi:plasmid stability protein
MMSHIAGGLGMAVLTIRGCDENLAEILKETGRRRGISVNRLVLETLRNALIGEGKKPRRYTDLDELAGTWSVAEADIFDRAVAEFESIEAEEWR